MWKCELCDAEATVGITEPDESGDLEQISQRHLCEECAQRVLEEYPHDSAMAAPPENETPEEFVARARQLAEAARNNSRQMASNLYDLYKRLEAIVIGQFGPPQTPEPQNREEWIDANVRRRNEYWDRFEAFVEKHKRWPTAEEQNYLHLLGE